MTFNKFRPRITQQFILKIREVRTHEIASGELQLLH